MYNTAMSEFIRVSKAVILNKEGKALVVLRGSTAPSRALTWDLPGGIVEDGETTLQTVQREVLEETDLSINQGLLSPIGKYEDYKYCWTVFQARISGEEVRLSWEHDKYKWIDKQELKRLKNVPDIVKEILEKALAA